MLHNPKPILVAVCRPATPMAADEMKMFAKLSQMDSGIFHAVRLGDKDLNIDDELNLENYSALLITGSQYTFTDPEDNKEEAQLLTEQRVLKIAAAALAADFPTFGMCYGLHALTLAAGGQLGHEGSEDIGVTQLEITDDGSTDEVSAKIAQPGWAFVGHHDAVTVQPANTAVLLTSEKCRIQLLRFGENVYGSQFHPEIDNQGMKLRVDYYDDGSYFPLPEKQRIYELCDNANVAAGLAVLPAFITKYFGGRHD